MLKNCAALSVNAPATVWKKKLSVSSSMERKNLDVVTALMCLILAYQITLCELDVRDGMGTLMCVNSLNSYSWQKSSSKFSSCFHSTPTHPHIHTHTPN